jgi:hypothetical protein
VSDEPADRPSKWRKRADELRVIAEGFNHVGPARDDLLQLARQWDEMAEREEIRSGVRARP